MTYFCPLLYTHSHATCALCTGSDFKCADDDFLIPACALDRELELCQSGLTRARMRTTAGTGGGMTTRGKTPTRGVEEFELNLIGGG